MVSGSRGGEVVRFDADAAEQMRMRGSPSR